MLGEIFWDVVPYVTLAIVVVGTWWRYRYDKFGWTTRSSQLYESRLLRIGSPMFHFGILVVIVGHVIGLLIPESFTHAIGLSEHAYHVQAVILGTIAGITTLAGVALLIYRRRTTRPGVHGDHRQRQGDVRGAGAGARRRSVCHRAGVRRRRRGVQLPRDGVGVVPLHLGIAAAR